MLVSPGYFTEEFVRMQSVVVRRTVIVLAWCALFGPSVSAAPVWQRLSLFKHVEAEEGKDYPLTEECGPWLILAVTFLGENAEQQAKDLVYEIRKEYKLPAYTHAMNFDFTEGVQGRTVNQYGRPATMKYRRGKNYEEIAVLVGDFSAVDDADAQRVLKELKVSEPVCMQPSEDNPSAQPLGRYREVQKQVLSAIDEYKRDMGMKASKTARERLRHGPLAHAFVTTNPLLPREYFVPSGVDPLVVRMNEQVEHSLLDCPGQYTVQVATFKGQVVVDPKEIAAVESGAQELDSNLAEAAQKAHELTQALIAKGYDAYEFHDRYMSIVTVGSFNSVGSPRADGKIEINPQIHRIMETFGGKQTGGAVSPKTIAGVALDVQPVPVKVPKQSISAMYSRSGSVTR